MKKIISGITFAAALSLRRLRCGLCFGLLVTSGATFAEKGEVVGLVKMIRSHDLTVQTDWFSLEGVTSAGSCNGALFMFKEDERAKRQIALVLAAQASGKKVLVGYDDINFKNGPYCFVRYLDVLSY